MMIKFIYPVINHVLRNVILGTFSMEEFEYKIRYDDNSEKIFIFKPNCLIDQGPLEKFTHDNLMDQIKDILKEN
jgi:hypothetical protein